MQKKVTVRVPPAKKFPEQLKEEFALYCGVSVDRITGYRVTRESLDARSRNIHYNITARVFIDEPFIERELEIIPLRDVHQSGSKVVIAGAGPAGIFAALRLISHGIRPIIVERGKNVRARRRDLAVINRKGIVNPESNYCFGEGGAGTYSDGKLYTRSTKRGDVRRILSAFVHYGAEERILYQAYPHIGTNKLPGIITAMRESIIASGGEVLFGKKVTDIMVEEGRAKGVRLAGGEMIESDAVILATGHSARDIFRMLYDRGIRIEFKPFALGIRIEHPQSLIDNIQYHASQHDMLPPASYSLVRQVGGMGVFSFCMCPGGIIAPAATAPGEVVVNGWSPSKRNNPWANSGIVVTVDEKHLSGYSRHGPLAGMYFQQEVEQQAFAAGGGRLVAPAQRMVDFTTDKLSGSLPSCSYLPGVHSAMLKNVLPPFIHDSLQLAFPEFGKKMPGFFTNEAIVVATESRTSSPVRIPRNESLQHPQVERLFPCAEGAGYAGGIMSAAMDGERVADNIAIMLGHHSASAATARR